MLKHCNECKTVKVITEFSAKASYCKPCVRVRVKRYGRTPYGRITAIYNAQKSSSITRGHPLPEYTKEQLYLWAIDNGLLTLIDSWESSNYDKNYTPSVDRLNSYLPYTLSNIRLTTWKDNNYKAYEDRKACIYTTSQNRRIEQLSLDGRHIAFYSSISNASRLTGITRTNINAMCKGKHHVKTVGGFIWRYAND